MKQIEINCGKGCVNYINSQNEARNYDSVHRNRGLWNNYRAVIVFGTMPKRISEEFTIKEVNCDNKFIESYISEIIQETRNKNIQKEKEEEIEAQERLKEYLEPEPVNEEDFMNIPEPIEYEPPEEPDPQMEEYLRQIYEEDEEKIELKIVVQEKQIKSEICRMCGKEILFNELSACAGGGYICKEHKKDICELD